MDLHLHVCWCSTYLKVRCGGRGQVHLMEPLQSFGIALTAAAGHSSCSQTSYTLQTTHTHTHTHTHTAVSDDVFIERIHSQNVNNSESLKAESCLQSSLSQSRLQTENR